MLNAAAVFSFLLLPFDNAKLSGEGRNMHKMQDGKKKAGTWSRILEVQKEWNDLIHAGSPAWSCSGSF